MVCRRCRGMLVRETFDDLRIETDARDIATRCLNCGCIEDAIIRANRSHPSMGTRVTLRGRRMVSSRQVVFSRIDAHAHALVR